MAAGVQIKAENLGAARALFHRIEDFGADPTELLDIWGGILEASTRRRFDTGQGPGGIPWPVSQRAKRDGGKTLDDKGNLEGSLRYEVRPGEFEIGFDGVGASSKYAYVHQFGAVIAHPGGTPYFIGEDGMARFVSKSALSDNPDLPLTKPHDIPIPARPMLGVDDDDKRDMLEVATEHLRSLIDGGP